MNQAESIVESIVNGQLENAINAIKGYRESPFLLDPILRRCVVAACEGYTVSDLKRRNKYLHVIYELRNVRGEKPVLQCLPARFELILQLVNNLHDEELGSKDYKVEHVLLLWLAAITLVPFDLNLVSPDLDKQLFDIGCKYLSVSGMQRDSAAVLLARLISHGTDEDIGFKLVQFKHKYIDIQSGSTFTALGVLKTLAVLLDRVKTVPTAFSTYIYDQLLAPIFTNERCSESEVKLAMKVLCRMALKDETYLDPGFEVFEQYLGHKSSKVRCTCAKYIARLESQFDNADIEKSCQRYLAMLQPSDDEDEWEQDAVYWSGMLVLFAELLQVAKEPMPIFVEQLGNCIKVRGLHFMDPSNSNQSSSQAVRDAACYVCWALFRSKADATVVYTDLCNSLTALAVLDREINVRRAAAAALQEGLGRYNLMPAEKKMEIIDRVNFDSLSVLKDCYLQLAPLFCSSVPNFMHYTLLHGVLSPDPKMQRLAASAIPLFSSLSYKKRMDELLKAQKACEISEHEVSDGVCMALGLLYSTHIDKGVSSYKLEDLKKVLEVQMRCLDTESSVEAALRLAVCDLQCVPTLIDAIKSDQPELLNAACDLMAFLEPEKATKQIVVDMCVQKIKENKVFVSCLCCLDVENDIYAKVASSTDAEIRAIALQNLTVDNIDCLKILVRSLCDYSVDARGDIGAVVRLAALKRVETLKIRSPVVQKCAWRLAGESNSRVSSAAAQALHSLEPETNVFGGEEEYFQKLLEKCPPQFRMALTDGIVQSVGGFLNPLLAKHALLAVAENVNDENGWILETIFSLNRTRTQKLGQIVSTLRKLLVAGFLHESEQALSIACSAVTKPVPITILMDAIDILQLHCPSQTARQALEGLLYDQPVGSVRQRAAEALYEAGITNEELEATDWSTTNRKQRSTTIKAASSN